MTPLRLIITLALIGAVVGCGDDNELAVRGEAAVTFSPDYVERFTFDADTRLQRDDLAAVEEGVFAGHCFSSAGAATEVDIEVERPGAVMGLTTFRIQSAAGEDGQMRAVVDGIIYDGSSDDGACTVTTLYAERRTAAVEVSCRVMDIDGNAADASAELHFTGCDRIN